MTFREEGAKRSRAFALAGALERGAVWVAPSLFGALLSVAVGPLSGFDLINLRWMAGWVMISGSDGLYGSVASLLTRPWLHDATIALLLRPGVWWLGPAVLGAVHGSLVPVVYKTVREITDSISKVGALILAWTSVLTPLVLMHFGRETGHLFAALFLGMSTRLFLKNPQAGFGIGLLLGVVPLVKFSALISTLVLGFAFFVGLSGLQRFRLVAGTASALWFGALLPSTLFAMRSGLWSELWLWGTLLPTVHVVGFSLGLLLALRWSIKWARPDCTDGRRLKSSRVNAFVFLTGVACLVWYLRGSAVADPRFRPPALSDLMRQFAMSGNARAPVALSDWEILYVDNSRILVAAFSTAAAVLMIASTRWTSPERRKLLTALAIGASIVVVQASVGYVRYASQSIALVPIAIACVVSLKRSQRMWKATMVLALSGILLLPAADVGSWFRAPGLNTYQRSGALLSEGEAALLSNLLPSESTVFLFGTGMTSAGPATGRTDLRWQLSPKRPEQVDTGIATLLYDPVATKDLDKFTTRGWVLDDCQTLRFQNISYGWCSMSTD